MAMVFGYSVKFIIRLYGVRKFEVVDYLDIVDRQMCEWKPNKGAVSLTTNAKQLKINRKQIS